MPPRRCWGLGWQSSTMMMMIMLSGRHFGGECFCCFLIWQAHGTLFLHVRCQTCMNAGHTKTIFDTRGPCRRHDLLHIFRQSVAAQRRSITLSCHQYFVHRGTHVVKWFGMSKYLPNDHGPTVAITLQTVPTFQQYFIGHVPLCSAYRHSKKFVWWFFSQRGKPNLTTAAAD